MKRTSKEDEKMQKPIYTICNFDIKDSVDFYFTFTQRYVDININNRTKCFGRKRILKPRYRSRKY